MKILFVAAEGVPFVKTGGLADVIGALPRALRSLGADVRVVLPCYGQIPDTYRQQMTDLVTGTVPLGWRNQYCGVKQLIYDEVPHYFIDNEYYFKRDSIYGCEDDAERFAYFCRAVLEMLPALSFQPDIMHCHDWHSGLVSLFLKTHYAAHPFYQSVQTVFTIHNLQYQGIFPHPILGDILGLSEDYFTIDQMEFYGQVNYMKAGLVYSDRLTTVSPTYASEIQHDYFGERLDGLLRHRQKDLTGILNGIDVQSYDPYTDPDLYAHADDLLRQKQINKRRLQKHFRLPEKERTPVIGMITRLTAQKGLDLVLHVIDEIMKSDVQMVILGSGEDRYEQRFSEFAKRYPDKLYVRIGFDERLARNIYMASDLFLMPSIFEPCGLSQMIAMRYGSIPIVRETGGLRDTVQSYNEATGTGNGFSFRNINAHDMLYAIHRALWFYQNPQVWNNLVKEASQMDFGWTNSARKYKAMYEDLKKMEDVT
ncbi:glycogen synthase GlgA [Fodinisporobacter ferrooxydans]|uniref:Glycogen synthase n=1 Tax=Fodinisporobacter ferrooxydans TaxID=2901836 RepID=A0ABY4CU25_9BACL|nr:glycogen synthase GlgA [Alicyclobacillaceae bacterium MYW30-H2]